MIITCEECSSSFNLDESLLKPTGSKVRCSICKFIFTAYPEEPDDVDLGLTLSTDDEDGKTPDEPSTDSTEIPDEISEPDITSDSDLPGSGSDPFIGMAPAGVLRLRGPVPGSCP